MRTATNQSDAQTKFFPCTCQPFSLPQAFRWWLGAFQRCVGGGDVVRNVMCWLRGEMKWRGWLWGDMRWGDDVMRLAGRRHIMSCNVMMRWCRVMLCHLIWFNFFASCHLTWCKATSHDVLSCDAMSSGVKWCNAKGWDEKWARDAMWLVVRSCCVIRKGCAMWWIRSWCAVNYWINITALRLRTSKNSPCYPITTPYDKEWQKILLCTPYYKV